MPFPASGQSCHLISGRGYFLDPLHEIACQCQDPCQCSANLQIPEVPAAPSQDFNLEVWVVAELPNARRNEAAPSLGMEQEAQEYAFSSVERQSE